MNLLQSLVPKRQPWKNIFIILTLSVTLALIVYFFLPALGISWWLLSLLPIAAIIIFLNRRDKKKMITRNIHKPDGKNNKSDKTASKDSIGKVVLKK